MILRKVYILIATLLVIIQISCKEGESSNAKVFIYNQPNPITSLDPAFAKAQNNIWAINHLFDGLVALDDSLNVIPAIAKSWEVTNEGKTLKFYLRNDVYFHENECFGANKTRSVTAHDVKFSLDRLLDAKVNSPGSWLFTDKIGNLPIFEVQDDATFILNLKNAFMPILGILTMQYCSITCPEAIEYYGDDTRSHPVGTGPFMLKRWEENQALFLQRNDKYALPRTDNIEYIKTTFITDKQIAMYEMLQGKLDFISGLESSFVNELLTRDGQLKPDKQNKIQYNRTPYLNMEYLGINMQLAASHPFLSQKSFRQALNYAIDKELMLRSLRNSVGRPANSGFIPAGLPSHNDSLVQGYKYNQEKAQKLLAASKYDGSIITITTNNEYLDICTFVSKQWENIGIKSKIEVSESAVLRDGMRKSAIQMFRASWIADYPDGESFLCMFYSINPSPPNYTNFKNEQFDQLYERSLEESNPADRITLYQQMDKIIIEESPVIFLFYDESSVFYNRRIQGFTNNGLNLWNTGFVLNDKMFK